MRYIIGILLLLLLSCKNEKRESVSNLLQEWNSKKFFFPSNLHFTSTGQDSIEYQFQTKGEYKIVVYVDSIGCTSCKLRLPAWKDFIAQVDSLAPETVQFLFFFFPKSKAELSNILMTDRFNYPVCIDEKDSLNILNNIPSETAFQTFLLNRKEEVIAIGNPIHNQKIKELYLKIIMGKKSLLENSNKLRTTVAIPVSQFDMGVFNFEKEQFAEFTFKNTGKIPFVIEDISTSCGCTTVDYSKEPIRPGESTTLNVKYKAEHPEHFNKTITVYCNAENSPLKLQITGNAE